MKQQSKTRKSNSKLWKSMTKERLQQIANESISFGEMKKRLGLTSGSSHKTVYKYVALFEIGTSHFRTNPHARGRHPRKPLEEIMVENSTYNRTHLKTRIIEENIIEYICSGCGNKGEWRGALLTLQLEHKNGKNNDHRRGNLEFLCPNCHTQTPTWGYKSLDFQQAKC